MVLSVFAGRHDCEPTDRTGLLAASVLIHITCLPVSVAWEMLRKRTSVERPVWAVFLAGWLGTGVPDTSRLLCIFTWAGASHPPLFLFLRQCKLFIPSRQLPASASMLPRSAAEGQHLPEQGGQCHSLTWGWPRGGRVTNTFRKGIILIVRAGRANRRAGCSEGLSLPWPPFLGGRPEASADLTPESGLHLWSSGST